jgi:predicted dehydrogenase
MDDARAMVALAGGTGHTYAVMQNRRFLKNIRALRQLLADGVIGQPGFFTADFFVAPHFGGFRDAMDSPLVLDMAIHTFDAARFLAGSDPVSVYCQEFNPPGSWYQGDAAAVAVFEFANGAVFCYRGSWCAEGAPTSWEGAWRITGSKGTAIWDGTAAPYAETPAPEDPAAEPVQDSAAGGRPARFLNKHIRVEATFPWQGEDGHNGCFAEMFDALREGRPAETDCTDNIKSMAMVQAALQSSREGRKIRIDLG